jgi:hypothetical protein
MPIVAFLLPVYQTLPAASGVTVCGIGPAGSGYSVIAPLAGSIRPIRLPHCPAHQIEPSAASTGSRERWPSVGTRHSLNSIAASPGISLGARRPFGGKCAARYRTIWSCSGLPDRSIIVPISSRQPSSV